jgi:hypothetical protein
LTFVDDGTDNRLRKFCVVGCDDRVVLDEVGAEPGIVETADDCGVMIARDGNGVDGVVVSVPAVAVDGVLIRNKVGVVVMEAACERLRVETVRVRGMIEAIDGVPTGGFCADIDVAVAAVAVEDAPPPLVLVIVACVTGTVVSGRMRFGVLMLVAGANAREKS